MRIGVYTAVCGGKDVIRPPKKFPSAKYILFTDKPIVHGGYPGWDEVRPLTTFSDDERYEARRAAKAPKVLSHLYMSDFDYTIWMDGSHDTITDPKEIVEKFLNHFEGRLWATFPHPQRDCIYAEAAALRNIGRWIEHPEVMDRQMAYYKAKGMPKNYGMPANTVIVRDKTLEVAELEMAWWEQICKFASRDQLSLPYCMWRLDFWKHRVFMDGHWQRNKYVALTQPHAKGQQ